MRHILCILFCSILFAPFIGYAQSEPARLDVLIESDTLTPAFYNGRSEPTPGSNVRAIAVMSGQAADLFSYRWEVNGTVLSDTGPVAVFPAPFGGSFLLRVDAITTDGQRAGSFSTHVSLTEPRVLFYEENLLRGLSNIVIPREFVLSADETTIRAEAYFVNSDIFNGSHEILWKIDGIPTQPMSDPQSITLRPVGGGSANIEFSLQNGSSLSQRVADSFTIHF